MGLVRRSMVSFFFFFLPFLSLICFLPSFLQRKRGWTWGGVRGGRSSIAKFKWGFAILVPPSPNMTLNTEIDFSFIASPQRVGSLVSTIGGPFCYMYI